MFTEDVSGVGKYIVSHILTFEVKFWSLFKSSQSLIKFCRLFGMMDKETKVIHTSISGSWQVNKNHLCVFFFVLI